MPKTFLGGCDCVIACVRVCAFARQLDGMPKPLAVVGGWMDGWMVGRDRLASRRTLALPREMVCEARQREGKPRICLTRYCETFNGFFFFVCPHPVISRGS